MTEPADYPPGTFCWVDLATTDPGAAKRFYAPLLGWTATDMPAGPDMSYSMFRRDGREVAALFGLSAQMRQQGVPSHWQSYISVENVDESAQRAAALDAAILMPPFDVLDAGRMALVQDPTGAGFALWEPRAHAGAGLVNEPGSLVWNELQTRDVETALEFYGAMFGWTSRVDAGAAVAEYHTLLNGERLAGGMLRIQPEWGEVAPAWAVYFAVESCAGTVEQAAATGGSVVVPPTELGGIGTFAFLADPQGAVFAVIAMLPGAAD